MRLLYFCVLIAMISVTFSCHKDDKPTIIKGKVVDRKSGDPIDKARFDLVLATQSGNNVSQSTDVIFTDFNGEFNHTITRAFDYIADFSTISKSGYVPRMQLGGMQKGKENDLNITLLPADAVLKIVVVNLSGDTKPFYFYMTNPIIGAESKAPPYNLSLTSNPLTLSKDEVHEEFFSLPESKNYVYWDFHLLDPITTASFKDSISVLSNDTVVYKITY